MFWNEFNDCFTKAGGSEVTRPLIIIFAALIFISASARFIALEYSPPGFFIDEAAGAVNTICISQDGKSESGVPHPLFFPQFGAYFTAPYIYFGAMWVKIFGYSIGSFRAIAALFSMLTIFGIGMLGFRFWGISGALFSALSASISPWSFQFSRLAWDPPLMPCFFIWGLYFFVISRRLVSLIFSGLLICVALYAYPPARVQIPLVLIPVIVFLFYKKKLNISHGFIWLASIVIPSVPLIRLTLDGTLQDRFRMLSVFSPYYHSQHPGESGFVLFIQNIFAHLSPEFLFFSGDHNLRHSTQYVGELSWFDDFALVIGVVLGVSWIYQMIRSRGEFSLRREINTIRFLCWSILAGIFPAALTWESVPHALRALGAWPFFSLLSGYFFTKMYELRPRIAWAGVLVSVLYIGCFSNYFFGTYPKISPAWFDSNLKDLAIEAKQSGDWSKFTMASANYAEVSSRYYLIEYGGKSCSSSLQEIRLLREKFLSK